MFDQNLDHAFYSNKIIHCSKYKTTTYHYSTRVMILLFKKIYLMSGACELYIIHNNCVFSLSYYVIVTIFDNCDKLSYFVCSCLHVYSFLTGFSRPANKCKD